MTPHDLAAALRVHPLVAEILVSRGCDTVEAASAFLDPNLYQPTPPHALPGMSAAVERLRNAIARGERIRVWGDFDVDGQTATSVLVLGLRALGAEVDYTIPNRATHSHGLNRDGLSAAADHGVRVLLTCDCGVTDFAEIAFARELGLDVIVTDHHDLERDAAGEPHLPDALAVINPKRLPPEHALGYLPGVGVAYKLIEALAAPAALEHLLDLVALGIVADLAYQRDDTRYLLQRGLEALRRAPRPGIRALMRAAGIEPLNFDADDIGFQIGPRLNAAGRLDSAALSVDLLTCDDPGRAHELAAMLEGINAQRKALQREVEADALAMLERDPSLAQPAVVVLQSSRWHASLLGVAASTVVNRTHKPAILISAEPGALGRGSARSVDGVDIHAAIAEQAGLIESSGGHPGAAGFAIRAENVAPFRAAVIAHVEAQLRTRAAAGTDAAAEAVYDIAWGDVGLPLAEQLERLAPFGVGNRRPLLRSAGLRFVRAEPLGKGGQHQVLLVQDAGGQIGRVTWWRSVGRALPAPGAGMTLIFTLQRDVFNARVRAQVHAHALEFDGRHVESDPDGAPRSIAAGFIIQDWRAEGERWPMLRDLIAARGADAVQVWSHADAPAQLDGFAGWVNRARLQPRPVLVIWDAPPGPDELVDAMARAEPQTVVLACRAPAGESRQVVLQLVRAMVATSEERGDALDDPGVVTRMAARINQRDATVREAIALVRAGADDSPRLRYLLEETQAYRAYAASAPAAEVLRA